MKNHFYSTVCEDAKARKTKNKTFVLFEIIHTPNMVVQSSTSYYQLQNKPPDKYFCQLRLRLLWVCVIETIKSVHSHLILQRLDLAYSINPALCVHAHTHTHRMSMAPWLNGWSFNTLVHSDYISYSSALRLLWIERSRYVKAYPAN